VSLSAESFGPEDFARATGATPAQVADVERYRALLETWNDRMNLVGPSALAAFWLRHAYDSAQLLEIASAPPPAGELSAKLTEGAVQGGARSAGGGGEGRVPLVWADLGAGAGFPGIILAILLKGREGAQAHLVESLTKRCRFLQAVVDELSLPAVIHNARAESTRLSGIEVVTARACAPMDTLLGYAQPILRGKVRGLFLKGKDAEAEVAEASRGWRFDVAMIPSKSDPSGRIVSVTRLARV
jgi:16S rRNA (guanine527-N7)-methyltransferase